MVTIRLGNGATLAVLVLILILFAVVTATTGVFSPLASTSAKGINGPTIPFEQENSTPQPVPFTQNWANAGLITTNDDWTGVPGIEGYFLRNDGVATTGVDPRTILGDTFGAGTTTVELDVTANQILATGTFGGIAEFHGEMPNFLFPTVGMQPDNTVDAPFLLITLNTTGRHNIDVKYAVYDLDCSADDALQIVATQYRIGNSGNFTNLPGEFVIDNTQGPNLCTQVTIMGGPLPETVANRNVIQVRIITTNAPGNDEWVGIDFIEITGDPIGGTPTPTPTPTHTPTPTATPTLTPTPNANIIVNEVDADQAGADTAEFIELFDGGVGNRPLGGLVVVLYDGATDTSYASYDLDGFLTNAGGYFTLGNATVTGADVVFPNGTLQDGADAVAVYIGNASNFPNGTAVTTANLLDAIVYDHGQPDDLGLLPLILGGGQVNENQGGGSTRLSMQRCPNGFGGARNTTAYRVRLPNADSINTCLAGPAAFDFDADGKTDISVFRASEGAWYLQRSSAGFFGTLFGLGSDKLAAADYDGDGRADIAVYRPSTGIWYVTNSSNATISFFYFGIAEDLPTPADYDGDGKADISVFRPSNGTWYRTNSSDGSFVAFQFGQNGDRPTIGDFDGDGRSDVAIFRPSTGVWFQSFSGNGSFFGEQFGNGSDKIAPGDYDGDGKADIGIYRPSEGLWYYKNSSNSTYTPYVFGLAQDIPVVGDYDGDGKADIGVFRPSDGYWYIVNSGNGSFTVYPWGQNGDTPIPNAYGN